MQRQTNAFSDFQSLQEQVAKMWEQLRSGSPGSLRFCLPMLEPPVDVYETANAVVVLLELAGIRDEQVELEVLNDSLIVRGQRIDRHNRGQRRYVQMEICYGPFERILPLPAQVNAEGAQVSYDDGFLEIVLPKVTAQVVHRVRIMVTRG